VNKSRERNKIVVQSQNQNQRQGGQKSAGINKPNQQGDNADQLRQQSGQLPKQQEQDSSRRGGEKNDQQDDPKNK
jgi:hypothetical protein